MRHFVDLTENALYKMAKKEWREKGRQEGMEKGIEEGMEEGMEKSREKYMKIIKDILDGDLSLEEIEKKYGEDLRRFN